LHTRSRYYVAETATAITPSASTATTTTTTTSSRHDLELASVSLRSYTFVTEPRSGNRSVGCGSSSSMAPYHAVDSHGVPKQRPAKETLSVRKDAHNAAKPAAPPPQRRDWQAFSATVKPTIRVIHIFAPKVIKTDMANFRSTVQKLTGRSTKKRGRRTNAAALLPVPPSHNTFTSGLLYDQERRSHEEVLQRLVGDACGTNNNNNNNMITPLLARSNSVESSTYSLDSGSDSNESLPSPTDSFSFYVPHRESAYSLSEIPAPFFDTSPCYNTTFASHSGGLGLQLPTPVMESMLSFDIDNLVSSDTTVGSDAPFPVLASGGSSGAGGLYDMLSVQHHCRLSVQPATFQGGNFFEMI
jgi:hypothetical protein